jgi:hypothetical protein
MMVTSPLIGSAPVLGARQVSPGLGWLDAEISSSTGRDGMGQGRCIIVSGKKVAKQIPGEASAAETNSLTARAAMEGEMRVLRNTRIVVVAGGLMMALTSAGWSQLSTGQSNARGSSPQQQQQQLPPLTPTVPPDMAPSPQMEQDQAKLRNVDRQKQLVSDTDKLLALANELKVDVDKSNKDTLSLDVIRKADEIEKLAHSVKEKMKGS